MRIICAREVRRDEVKVMTRRMLAQVVLAGLTLDDVLEASSEAEREVREELES